MASSTSETITVHVRLHNILRRPAAVDGTLQNQVTLTLPLGSQIKDLLLALAIPEMELLFVLNKELVAETALLKTDDHLSIIPPIAGGSGNKIATMAGKAITAIQAKGTSFDTPPF